MRSHGFPVSRFCHQPRNKTGKPETFAAQGVPGYPGFPGQDFKGLDLWAARVGGVVEVQPAPHFMNRLTAGGVAGPPWDLWLRVMRTPTSRVWVCTEHTEQVHDFKCISLLKMPISLCKNFLCHDLSGPWRACSARKTVWHLNAARLFTSAPAEFLAGKTGKTGNPLCCKGFRLPGFGFLFGRKPGNRESSPIFRAGCIPTLPPPHNRRREKSSDFPQAEAVSKGANRGVFFENRESTFPRSCEADSHE